MTLCLLCTGVYRRTWGQHFWNTMCIYRYVALCRFYRDLMLLLVCVYGWTRLLWAQKMFVQIGPNTRTYWQHWWNGWCDSSCLLWLVHTANADKSVFAVWTELVTSLSATENFEQFCPVLQCCVNWVLSCPDPVSNSHATWLPIVTSYLETWSRLVHKCVHTADETKLFCLHYIENCLSLSEVWTSHKSQWCMCWSYTYFTEAACTVSFHSHRV